MIHDYFYTSFGKRFPGSPHCACALLQIPLFYTYTYKFNLFILGGMNHGNLFVYFFGRVLSKQNEAKP